MEGKRKYSMFLFLLLLTFLTRACQVQAWKARENIQSCLSSGGVRNVSTSSNPNYSELLTFSIKNLRFTKPSVKKPVAVIFPEDVKQVATAVQCATKMALTIRVRSGGHSYEGLSSTAGNDGPFVIIDMMRLDQITVDLASETAWVQTGATVGNVYYTIGKSSCSHAFSAGICPTVGSGGQFSGGGHGALVRKYGLAADNIVDAILVDARGRILDRKAMGRQVFWAIRGGGGGCIVFNSNDHALARSWGVVVQWKIRLLRVPERVAAFRVDRPSTVSQAAELWHKWQSVAPYLEDDFYLGAAVFPGSDNISVTMTFMGLYLGPKSLALASVNEAFPALGITPKDFNEMSWLESVVVFDIYGPPKTGFPLEYLKTTSKSTISNKIKSDYVKTPLPIHAMEGILQKVAGQPIAGMLFDVYGGMVKRIKSDSIAFPHRNNLYAIQYLMIWQENDDGNTDEYIDWIRKLYEYTRPFVSKNPRAVYVNFVDLDLGVMDWKNKSMDSCAVQVARAWGEKYFLRNYDRLVRAKTAIDPNNVFRNPQSIPPLNLKNIS